MKILTLACLLVVAAAFVSSKEYGHSSKYDRRRTPPGADYLGGIYSRAQRRTYVRGYRGRHHNLSEETKEDTNQQENSKSVSGSRFEESGTDTTSASQDKKYVPNYRGHRNVSQQQDKSSSNFGEDVSDSTGSETQVRTYARGGRRGGISKKPEEDLRELDGTSSYGGRGGGDALPRVRGPAYGSVSQELSKEIKEDPLQNGDLMNLRYRESLRKRERIVPQIITGSSSGRIYRGYPQTFPDDQKVITHHMENGGPFDLRYGDKLESYTRGYGGTQRFAETTTQVVQPPIKPVASIAPSQQVSETSHYQVSSTTSVPTLSSLQGSMYVSGYDDYTAEPKHYSQQPYKTSLIGANQAGDYGGALSYVHISQGFPNRQQPQQKLTPYNKEVWVPVTQRYQEQPAKSYYTPVPRETLYHTKHYPVTTARPYQVYEEGTEAAYAVSNKKIPNQERIQSQIPLPVVASAPVPTPAPVPTHAPVQLPKLPVIQDNKNAPIYQHNFHNYVYPQSNVVDYGDRAVSYRGLQLYATKELTPQQESFIRSMGATVYRPYIIPVTKNAQQYYQTHGYDGGAQGQAVSYRETAYGGSGNDVRNGYDANGYVLKNGGYYVNGGKLASATRGGQTYHHEDLYRGGQESVNTVSVTKETPAPAQHPYLVRYVKNVDLSLPYSAPASAHKNYDNFRTYADVMEKNVNYQVDKRNPYSVHPTTKVSYSQPDPLHFQKPISYSMNHQINVPVSQQMSFYKSYPSNVVSNNYDDRGYEVISNGAYAGYQKKDVSQSVPWRNNYQRQASVHHA